MRLDSLVFAAFLLLTTQFLVVSYGSGATVQANVVVACPFSLSENALSVYNIGNSITLNYTIFTQAQCTINALQGTFVLQYSGNNVQVLSDPLFSTAIQSPVLYSLPAVNTLTLSPGSYRAIVNFTAFGASNESVQNLLLVSPVDITLSEFAVNPSQASVGLPLTFTMNLVNDGQLASGTIGLNIIINGPQYFDFGVSASALSPSQNELVSFTVNNATGVAGSYTVSAYATFASGNAVRQSNTENIFYYVTAPVTPPAPPSTVTQPIASVPQLTLSQVPAYSSLSIGSSILSGMNLLNIIGVPETVTLSIPKQFDKMFTLAAHSVYLLPNESLQVQMSFNSNGTNQTGVFVIPVNISVSTLNGATVSGTQYLTYVVQRSNFGVSLYNQIQLSQSSATVTTSMVGARTRSFTNATLVTTLPGAVVSNASQVKTYGLPAVVTTFNGTNLSMAGAEPHAGKLNPFLPPSMGDRPSYTVIRWLIPYLPEGKTITMAYTITHPLNVGLLTSIQNLLVAQAPVASSSILRVVDIQAPTFYQNSSNKVTVGVLYTGTALQPVKFTLSTSGVASIVNPVQVVNASPNQLIQRNFYINTGNETGTLLFNLYIDSANASVNYTLPVIVLQKSGTSLATTTVPQTVSSLPMVLIIRYLPWVAGLAIVCIAALMIRRSRRGPRYSVDRAKELIRIREQIKRSDEHV